MPEKANAGPEGFGIESDDSHAAQQIDLEVGSVSSPNLDAGVSEVPETARSPDTSGIPIQPESPGSGPVDSEKSSGRKIFNRNPVELEFEEGLARLCNPSLDAFKAIFAEALQIEHQISAAEGHPAQAREVEKTGNRAGKPPGSRGISPVQVHDEGVGAFLRGVGEEACPYDDRLRHAAWRKGWSEMRGRTASSPHLAAAPIIVGMMHPLAEVCHVVEKYWPLLSDVEREFLVDWLICTWPIGRHPPRYKRPIAQQTASRLWH